MSEGRVALVTGGTGFIGSRLLKRLFSEGWTVHAVARPDSDMGRVQEGVKIHVHDGSMQGIKEIVADSRPDVVFHLASLFLSEHASDDVERLVSSNVLFGAQLAEAMSVNGACRLVNTGTSWQHYQNKDYSPVNLYAATKQAYEAILQYYIEAKSLEVVTLKLFDTYGRNDPRPKLFHLLGKVARTNEPLAMSPGEQLIDLVHVDDVVNAYLVAANRLLNGKVKGHESYAVSSDHPIPLRKIVEMYENALGRKLPIHWGGRPYRGREVMKTWGNGTLLPGWKAEIGLDAGIVQVVDSETSVH